MLLSFSNLSRPVLSRSCHFPTVSGKKSSCCRPPFISIGSGAGMLYAMLMAYRSAVRAASVLRLYDDSPHKTKLPSSSDFGHHVLCSEIRRLAVANGVALMQLTTIQSTHVPPLHLNASLRPSRISRCCDWKLKGNLTQSPRIQGSVAILTNHCNFPANFTNLWRRLKLTSTNYLPPYYCVFCVQAIQAFMQHGRIQRFTLYRPK